MRTIIPARLKKILVFSGLLALALVWIRHAYTCPWSQDEGFYLYFARLVADRGQTPFVDFAYPQGPVFPYLLGAWVSWFDDPLIGGRWLSALSFFGFLALAVRWWSRRGVRTEVAAAAVVLIAFHPLVWNYVVLVKPYAFTLFLLLIALSACLDDFVPGIRPGLALALGGASLGIACGTRLNFLFALPCLVACLWKSPRRVLWFLSGFAVSVLPFLWFLFRDFDRTVFNLFLYQSARSGLHGLAAWAQRWATVRATLIDPRSLVGVVFAVWALWAGGRSRLGAFLLLVSLFVVLPLFGLSPFYDEYLVTLYAFSVFAVALAGSSLPRGAGLAASAAMVLLFVLFGRSGLAVFANPGRDSRPNGVRNMERVGAAISARTGAGEEILTFWNGYAVASRRWLPPGLESGLAVKEMAGRLPSDFYGRYHIATVAQVGSWIDGRRTRVAVVGLASPPGFEERVRTRYRPAGEVGGARIYTRR